MVSCEPEAFPQPVASKAIEAMCRRAFGSEVRVGSVTGLALGTYNSVYRIELVDHAAVVLRVAPQARHHSRIQRDMMRNEHAGLPFLAPLGRLVPRTLMADFTRQIVDRDYLFQPVMPGVPAPEAMAGCPRPQWAALFRGIGAVARRINDVRGRRFGPIAAPVFDSWSEALIAYFGAAVADLDDVALDSDDIRAVSRFVHANRPVFDEVAEPRFLHGDLWTANVMVEPNDPRFRITAVLDWDRACWGDPSADWAVYRALARPGHRARCILGRVRRAGIDAESRDPRRCLPGQTCRGEPARAVQAQTGGAGGRDLHRDRGHPSAARRVTGGPVRARLAACGA